MKGQYLALEAIMTAIMGIVLAIGVIGYFQTYKSSTLEAAQEEISKRKISRVKTALIDLKTVSTGIKTIELPEEIAGSEYQVSLDKKVRLFVDNREYSSKKLGFNADLTGTANGGEVKIFKNQNNYTLQEG
ncbi:MAG: hypothetical protein ABEJ83_05650 [Candidatus Nanohaloarchaea archaeon]